MGLRHQSAIEMLSTYGLMIFIVTIAIALIVLLSYAPNTSLPNTCSLYSSLRCTDMAYAANTNTGGSTLAIEALMDVPGILNANSFNAVVGGVKSTSGFCTTNGISTGPTSVSQGQYLICIATFNSPAANGKVYSGVFNITGNYCATSNSKASCPSGTGYTIAGSWKGSGSYSLNVITVSTSTSTLVTTVSTSVSSVSTTSIATTTTTIIYAYVQGGTTNSIDAIDTVSGNVFKIWMPSGVGSTNNAASCITVTANQSEAYLVYNEGLYVYTPAYGNVVQVSGIGSVNTAVTQSIGGQYVYVASGGTSGTTLSVYTVNTQTNSVVNTIAFSTPSTMYVTRTLLGSGGTFLYVSANYSGSSSSGALYTVNVISDTLYNTITEGGIADMIINPSSGNYIYLAELPQDAIQSFSTATNSITNTIAISGNTLRSIAISPDGSTLYATSLNGNVLLEVSTSSNAVSKTLSLPTTSPLAPQIALSSDGTTAYIPAGAAGKVFVVSTASATLSNTISLGGSPFQVALTPDGSTLYVTNTVGASIAKVSTSTYANTILNGANVILNPNYIAIGGGSFNVEPT